MENVRIWKLGKETGLTFEGDDNVIVNKIQPMEDKDRRREKNNGEGSMKCFIKGN